MDPPRVDYAGGAFQDAPAFREFGAGCVGSGGFRGFGVRVFRVVCEDPKSKWVLYSTWVVNLRRTLLKRCNSDEYVPWMFGTLLFRPLVTWTCSDIF